MLIWAQLDPAVFVISVPNRSCRFADWGGGMANSLLSMAAAGSWIVDFVAQVFVPAGTFEKDQKERPEGGYARCDDNNVGLIGIPYPKRDRDIS